MPDTNAVPVCFWQSTQWQSNWRPGKGPHALFRACRGTHITRLPLHAKQAMGLAATPNLETMLWALP
jgi:hypothetical protein